MPLKERARSYERLASKVLPFVRGGKDAWDRSVNLTPPAVGGMASTRSVMSLAPPSKPKKLTVSVQPLALAWMLPLLPPGAELALRAAVGARELVLWPAVGARAPVRLGAAALAGISVSTTTAVTRQAATADLVHLLRCRPGVAPACVSVPIRRPPRSLSAPSAREAVALTPTGRVG